MAILHCLEEDIFQRVTLVTQSTDLHFLLRGDAVEIADFDSLLQYHLETMISGERIFTTQLGNRRREPGLVAARFQHQKLTIRLAFLFEVAINNNAAFLQDQYFFATLFNVAQQMRREYDIGLPTIANLAYQPEHAGPCRRIEAVRRFIKKN